MRLDKRVSMRGHYSFLNMPTYAEEEHFSSANEILAAQHFPLSYEK
jgi:hypothetical protein